MVDSDAHVFWTVLLYSWPYACIPLAFSIDGKLRARWHLEDVSRPASGYRFKGTNVQMVLTSRSTAGKPKAHGRSRGLECTSLWPVSVIGPAVFVFAAEWSSGAVSVLLVCTPFVVLTLVSLTLNQVCGCRRLKYQHCGIQKNTFGCEKYTCVEILNILGPVERASRAVRQRFIPQPQSTTQECKLSPRR